MNHDLVLAAPDRARALHAAPEGLVRVTTRRGAIVSKARADRQVPEGMIFIPFCFAETAANLLTNPQLDAMGKIPDFKYCAARVEAVSEAAMSAE